MDSIPNLTSIYNAT